MIVTSIPENNRFAEQNVSRHLTHNKPKKRQRLQVRHHSYPTMSSNESEISISSHSYITVDFSSSDNGSDELITSMNQLVDPDFHAVVKVYSSRSR